jgi:hypothetical protein
MIEALPSRTTRSYWRSLTVVALTIPAMLLVDYGVSYASVVAMVADSLPLLIVAIVVGFVLLAASIIALSKIFLGRLSILGAAVTTGFLAWAGAFGFLNGVLHPLALQEGVLLHVAVCGMSALSLGLFLGPWPLRIAGAISMVGLIAGLALTPTPMETAVIERESAEAERVQTVRSEWIDSGRFPLVTDLPGWSNVEVRATGTDAGTWVRSDTGAVAQIITQWDAPPPDPVGPCNFIGGPGLDWDRGVDQLPTWCIRSGNQWARADGSAIYSYDDGTATWMIALGGYEAERVGGSTAATAQDISALFPSLRTMSREEAEHYLLPTFDGMNSPEVRTPGL